MLHIASRSVSCTVAWRADGEERVADHRVLECRWQQLDQRGRRQTLHEILSAVAERNGLEIHSIYVSLSDPSLRGNFATGYAELGQPLTLTVAERDLALVRATQQAIGAEREVLHALPQRWEVRDGQSLREVDEPVGQVASRLTCHVLLITATRAARAEVEPLLADLGVVIEGILAQPVALYRGIAGWLGKRGSTLVIDHGARHTSLLVHRKQRLVHVETHAFGSDHLTDAIALELGLPLEQAEETKRHCEVATAGGGREAEGQTFLWREVQERQRHVGAASRICAQSLRAFFSERAQALRDQELLAQTGRVHVVGRGAGIAGLTTLLKEVFRQEVVLGTNRPDREPSSEMADLLTAGLVRQAGDERARKVAERQGSGIRQMTSAATGFMAWLLEPLS